MNLKTISAGAGSGKTYRLTSELVSLLESGVSADGVIATTFTKKAAAELQERVRVRLLESGMQEQADDLNNALIGTVHGLGVKLLERFAYEAGVAPEASIIADEDHQTLFDHALATVLHENRVATMEQLCERLGLSKNEYFDWRKEVRKITEVARTNDLSLVELGACGERSWAAYSEHLPPPDLDDQYLARFTAILQDTIRALAGNEDSTKQTKTALGQLKRMAHRLQLGDLLSWPDWAQLSKLKVGAKSRDAVSDLIELAQQHERLATFQDDIKSFLDELFGIAVAALEEYEKYKKKRGLIDYTDMEVLVNNLLDHPQVRQVLGEELELLMVDEFQDTSPIQLSIFLKLSQIARYSVWVGDPKQSIYGFRGAAPELMEAIIKANGGVRPEDIQTHSWRSREDIVAATNALFTKAFAHMPAEQVALQPKRTNSGTPNGLNKAPEPPSVGLALVHWHFKIEQDEQGRRLRIKNEWTNACIARSLKTWLERGSMILPKGEKQYRKARPGDVAILCRSNKTCQQMADTLHRAGLRAAISRAGLVKSAEAQLTLACFRYLMNQEDALAVAEILRLYADYPLEDIVAQRSSFLQQEENLRRPWTPEHPLLARLDQLRTEVRDLSSSEMLDLLITALDLRRQVVKWGRGQQRLDNLEQLRQYALQYEEGCNRMHNAASLAGYLLFLEGLHQREADLQGAGLGPDAVNLLTYHKSKGLEWPIVICHSLEDKIRADLWGLSLERDNETIELNDILAGAWLRYWVNPYDRQDKNMALTDRLMQTDLQARNVKNARQEEARLLYVGVTRARDYLVFPTTDNPARWLNRTWHDGEEGLPTLDPDTQESPWCWEGRWLQKETEVFYYPKDLPVASLHTSPTLYPNISEGLRTYPTERYDLRQERLQGAYQANTGVIKRLSPPIDKEKVDAPYLVGKAIKAFLAADLPTYADDQRLHSAAGMVRRFEISDDLPSNALVRYADQFWSLLQEQYQVERFLRKYPLVYWKNKRCFETVIDLLAHTASGPLIIQHSGYAGGRKKWRDKALELGDWFYLSKEGINAVLDQSAKTILHFVLDGALVDIQLVPRQISLFEDPKKTP